MSPVLLTTVADSPPPHVLPTLHCGVGGLLGNVRHRIPRATCTKLRIMLLNNETDGAPYYMLALPNSPLICTYVFHFATLPVPPLRYTDGAPSSRVLSSRLGCPVHESA
jgi:hypothetical protein